MGVEQRIAEFKAIGFAPADEARVVLKPHRLDDPPGARTKLRPLHVHAARTGYEPEGDDAVVARGSNRRRPPREHGPDNAASHGASDAAAVVAVRGSTAAMAARLSHAEVTPTEVTPTPGQGAMRPRAQRGWRRRRRLIVLRRCDTGTSCGQLRPRQKQMLQAVSMDPSHAASMGCNGEDRVKENLKRQVKITRNIQKSQERRVLFGRVSVASHATSGRGGARSHQTAEVRVPLALLGRECRWRGTVIRPPAPASARVPRRAGSSGPTSAGHLMCEP